jgi:hypothetical protein
MLLSMLLPHNRSLIIVQVTVLLFILSLNPLFLLTLLFLVPFMIQGYVHSGNRKTLIFPFICLLFLKYIVPTLFY